MVYEYLEIFPNDRSELPPDCEIEFVIDQYLRIPPIFKSSTHTSISQMETIEDTTIKKKIGTMSSTFILVRLIW